MAYKLGSVSNGVESQHRFENAYSCEVFPGWSRVTIGANEAHIDLLLELARTWQGPYGILYVLVVSRLDNEPGRYQIPEPCEFGQLETFAREFRSYFESDGRHHVWFMDVATGAELIYDNHNLIYSYGHDEVVKEFLCANGFTRAEIQIPKPHIHHYHAEFDPMESRIMRYFEWRRFPLVLEHDDP